MAVPVEASATLFRTLTEILAVTTEPLSVRPVTVMVVVPAATPLTLKAEVELPVPLVDSTVAMLVLPDSTARIVPPVRAALR